MAVRGTTPGYILEIEDYDLTNCDVYVTIRRSTKKITLTGDRLTVNAVNGGSNIIFQLTQEETLSLTKGNAEVQVRFIDENGTALATEIANCEIYPVLYEEVITYGANSEDTP